LGGWCCRNKVLGVAIACSNTFGLVTGAFLLGFGLVEIPRSMWRNADLQYRQKVLSHKIAKAAVKLDDAHQELSTAIVIAQATSNQMARHDSLRPCMDVIDEIMTEMVCMLCSYNNFYDTGFWAPARCCHRLGAFTE
jgi:hypothetical protein